MFRFKTGNTRLDPSPGISLIMDLKTGETTSLMRPQMTDLKISGDMARTALVSVQRTQGDHLGVQVPLMPTGEKGVISGYTGEKYPCRFAGERMTLRLTKKSPSYEDALNEHGARFNGCATAAVMQNNWFGLSALPGFPVRTVPGVQPGQTMTRTVISANAQLIPAMEFHIPAD